MQTHVRQTWKYRLHTNKRNNMELHFTYNWNNKLDGDYYTTIRLHNPKRYYSGAILDIHLNNVLLHSASIVDVRVLLPKQFNHFITGIDGGMDVPAFITLLRRFYGKDKAGNEQDIYTLKFDFILLNKIKE